MQGETHQGKQWKPHYPQIPWTEKAGQTARRRTRVKREFRCEDSTKGKPPAQSHTSERRPTKGLTIHAQRGGPPKGFTRHLREAAHQRDLLSTHKGVAHQRDLFSPHQGDGRTTIAVGRTHISEETGALSMVT